MNEGFVRSPDLDIHYYRTTGGGTDGEKPTLVLLHGATDDGLCWTPLIRALEETWDVVAPDSRGHGLSGSGRGDYGPDARKKDLIALLEALELEHPVLGGHSMGAESAILASLDLPGRIRALVLEDPSLRLPGKPLFGGPWSRFEKAARRGYRWIFSLFKKLPRPAALFLARLVNPAFPKSELPAWTESKRKLNPDYFDAFLTLRTDDLPPYGVLGEIEVPTLLFVGDRSEGSIISLDEAEKAAEGNANVRIVHRSGSDHNIRRRDMDGYIRDIAAFLGGLPNRRRADSTGKEKPRTRR